MQSCKTFYSLLILLIASCFYTRPVNAQQCNCPPADTYIVNGNVNLTGYIPSTGNNYCIEVLSNSTLRVDGFWSADNICINVSPNNGSIVIETGQLANLTNSTVDNFGNLLIDPFVVENGATFQVGHTTVQNVNVGFSVQGSLHLDDVDISCSPTLGVAIDGTSSDNIYIDNAYFHDLSFGITLQGIDNNLTVINSDFDNISFHGLAATGVDGVVTVYNNDFADLQKAMHFGSGLASYHIRNNTTDNVETGIYVHTADYLSLGDNDFSFDRQGADLRYIETLSVYGNIFRSVHTNPIGLNRIGLDVTNSNGAITENTFRSMDIGAYFREYNGFDDAFTSNLFTGNKTYGLYLADGARIGPQCHQHNLWYGNYSQTYGAYSPDFGVKFNSTFTVNKYAPGEWPAHSPSGWFVHDSEPCPEDEVPHEPGPGLVGNDSPKSFQLRLAPNPASDYLEVTLPATEASSEVLLRDLNGRVLQSRYAAATTNLRFDLTNVQSGVYFIVWKTDDYQHTERVVVTK